MYPHAHTDAYMHANTRSPSYTCTHIYMCFTIHICTYPQAHMHTHILCTHTHVNIHSHAYLDAHALYRYMHLVR